MSKSSVLLFLADMEMSCKNMTPTHCLHLTAVLRSIDFSDRVSWGVRNANRRAEFIFSNTFCHVAGPDGVFVLH